MKSPCASKRVCIRLHCVSCSVKKPCFSKNSMRTHCKDLFLQTVRKEPPRSVQSRPKYSTIYIYIYILTERVFNRRL